jgi:hypothetical protein
MCVCVRDVLCILCCVLRSLYFMRSLNYNSCDYHRHYLQHNKVPVMPNNKGSTRTISEQD